MILWWKRYLCFHCSPFERPGEQCLLSPTSLNLRQQLAINEILRHTKHVAELQFAHHCTTPGSPNYGPRSRFVNDEKVITSAKFIDLVECNISPNHHITKDVRPLNFCVMTYLDLCQESLEIPALHHAECIVKQWRGEKMQVKPRCQPCLLY